MAAVGVGDEHCVPIRRERDGRRVSDSIGSDRVSGDGVTRDDVGNEIAAAGVDGVN